MRDYIGGRGECGLQIKSKFIDKQWHLYKPTPAMKLGTWFEYKLTKALPKGNEIPQPLRTAKGLLTAPFKRIEKHIEHFNMLKKELGFIITEVGKTWVHEDLAGTLDLLCIATKDIYYKDNIIVKKGQEFIADIKTTGLLDNKWEDYGWNIDNLGNKSKLITQPIHYKYIGEKKFKKDFPFLFFLFSTANEDDYRVINFEIDKEEVYKEHEYWIEWTRRWINRLIEKGFTAEIKTNDGIIYPTVKKCAICPLRENCKSIVKIPQIQTFYHNIANIDENYNH